MNPVDPYYARLSHTRHWITNSSSPKKQKHHRQKPHPRLKKQQQQQQQPQLTSTTVVKTETVKKKKVKHVDVFNAEVLDTFCFHWPDMHSYVLVRVLEKTIAILPVRSRLAFLYFHHAPMPSHPSPRELRKALMEQPLQRSSSKRIQGMFKNWKHTLAFEHSDVEEVEEEEEGNEDEEDEDEDGKEEQLLHSSASLTPINSATPSTPLIETPPSTPKADAHITLSDVLSYEPNLKTGWIHAPCTVKDDENMFDNIIVLTTKHTTLKLTSRCFTEKMMFMNLVKLKHAHLHLKQDEEEEEDDKTIVEGKDSDSSSSDSEQGDDKAVHKKEKKPITSMDVMTHLQRKTTHQLQNIHQLTIKLDRAKENISYYTQELVELEHALDHLMERTHHVQQMDAFKQLLDFINQQLSASKASFQSYRERVSAIQERVSVHTAFLTGAIQRFEQLRHRVQNHAWYPWFYTSMAGIVLAISMLIGYYFYAKS